jgi:hypothetical protein
MVEGHFESGSVGWKMVGGNARSRQGWNSVAEMMECCLQRVRRVVRSIWLVKVGVCDWVCELINLVHLWLELLSGCHYGGRFRVYK